MLRLLVFASALVCYANASLVHIQVTARSRSVRKCGGSLVARNFVLTAASCFEDAEKTQARKISMELVSPDSGLSLPVSANAVFLQPCYDGTCGDLALIRLDRPVRSSFNVARYAVQQADDLWTGVGGDAQVYATWETWTRGTRLALNMVSLSLCSGLNGTAGQCSICASAPSACDSGSVDVGAPLVVKAGCSGGSDWDDVVVGVSTSAGSGCGRSVGVYTRVSLYSVWIRDVISPGSESLD